MRAIIGLEDYLINIFWSPHMPKHSAFLCLAILAAGPARAEDIERFDSLAHDIARRAAQQAKIQSHEVFDLTTKHAGPVVFHKVELILDASKPVYEVVFFKGAEEAEVEIDAVTGKILISEPMPADLRFENPNLRPALEKSKTSLAAAIDAARKHAPGATVIRAETEMSGNSPTFLIELLKNNDFSTLRIDAEGRITPVPPLTDRNERCWTFDRDSAGKPPPGWTFGFTTPAEGKARWTVEKDPKPMSGPNVLNLDAASGPRAFNLAIADATHYGDLDLSTRLRANSGKIDQGGGLIWRCKDSDNYYICRLNPLESNFRVYHVVKEKRTQLASLDVKADSGKWYALRVKMIGDHIQCFLDGRKLLDVHDKTITAPGRVGLWTKADASSSFDNITVRKALPATSDTAPVADPGAPAKRDPDGDDDD